ncbi:helix-turn-helix domain-containing protein [Nocardia arthritidis]|uniref:Helix-turn-helix domain-containing protein n=1 Tax=Nocardia arthritidis TaxID=228602 RepID=A0A6G9YI33_9NOCA|nr:helix-turn-helix domain-containing protein [Nocardia arthritidis]QIS12851.1 helix-turn-helix domain-containing protein [Nocardia arthritidis]
MGSTGPGYADTGRAGTAWDVARPARPSRVRGIDMGGFRDRNRGPGPIELRVIPHPSVTLVLEFGDGSLELDVTGGHGRGSFVAGLAPTGVCVRAERIECVEVRLSPLVARNVFGAAPDGSVVTLDELWGPDAARIREQLGESTSWDERFALTDDLLTRRAAVCPSVDPEVAWAWERIIGSRGRVRVEVLAAEIGWSRGRLWSRFRSQIGVPPKYAAKLVRFDNAARRLAAGHGAAQVAAECGYVDQSHLHREVMAFTGRTPRTLAVDDEAAAERLAFANEQTFVQDSRP